MRSDHHVARLMDALKPKFRETRETALQNGAKTIEQKIRSFYGRTLRKLKYSFGERTKPSHVFCVNCEHAVHHNGGLFKYGCDLYKGRCSGFRLTRWRKVVKV